MSTYSPEYGVVYSGPLIPILAPPIVLSWCLLVHLSSGVSGVHMSSGHAQSR